MKKLPEARPAILAAIVAGCVFALPMKAQAPASSSPTANPSGATSSPSTPVRKFKATDADNHNILINKPGVITLLLGTNEDSQDAARAAGEAVYPYRGRPDFDLIVVVDLRDSIAAWAPTVVLAEMRSNLDKEVKDLKPYFLQNGNTSNPRNSMHVIADFTGTICPQLGWPAHTDDLRAILFGGDGREIKRWDKLEDMAQMQSDVHAAIEAFDQAQIARAAAAGKTQGTKVNQPPSPPRPLPVITPPAKQGAN
jgi:hypothetical protein